MTQIATLLCNPDRARLDPTLLTALRQAWGGAEPVWLSSGEAAEFAMPREPENLWTVWEDLQMQGVDLVVQPAGERRRKLLLADMDSTMIQQECIDELAAEIGVGPRVAAITARAMNGELDFEAALIERVGLLRGLDAAVIDEVLRKRITLMPGARELVATMKRDGAYAALVSGGFTAFTQSVARQLGFDEHRANSLEIRDGRLTGEVARPILGQAAKLSALEELTERLGLAASDVLAVGDGANDLAMLHRAGSGVALHAKPAVAAQCRMRVNHGDLTALLFLQGYRREGFVIPDGADSLPSD